MNGRTDIIIWTLKLYSWFLIVFVMKDIEFYQMLFSESVILIIWFFFSLVIRWLHLKNFLDVELALLLRINPTWLIILCLKMIFLEFILSAWWKSSVILNELFGQPSSIMSSAGSDGFTFSLTNLDAFYYYFSCLML